MANPRPPLTPERIDEAALALVDQGGMRALSMRKLGAALGVDPMAIYHHVDGKQELFHRLVRHVFSGMPAPDPTGAWDDRVRAWAHAYRMVVAAHPALVLTIITDTDAVAVAAAAATEDLHAALTSAGLDDAEVDLCADVVVDHANGAVLACAPGPDGAPPTPELESHLARAYAEGLEVVLAGIRAQTVRRGRRRGPGR